MGIALAYAMWASAAAVAYAIVEHHRNGLSHSVSGRPVGDIQE